jgi:exopolysaccharide production protein ExoQ
MDDTPQRLTAPRLVEIALAALLVVMMSDAVIGPIFDPHQLGGESSPFLRLMWLPAYGVMMLLAIGRTPRLLRFWLPAAGFGLLVLLAFASTQWSIDPTITSRRALAVAFTTLFGLYLAAAFEGRQLSELIAGTFLALALASLAVCIVNPAFGVHTDINAGAWKGVWFEKNQMGAMMVYGALAAASAALVSPQRRWLWIAAVALFAFMVVMSRSKTALLMLLVVMGGIGAFAATRRGPAAAILTVWLAAAGVLALGSVIWLAPEALFHALGKDPSLTGRTDIWALVLEWSAKKPLLGYGYAVFWSEPSIPDMWIDKDLKWDVPNAHNGWLDLLVQLGWTGVLIFAALFVAALLAALGRLGSLRDGGWAALYLAVFAIATYSESFILARNSLPWAMAVAAMARVLGPALIRQARPAEAPISAAPVPA